MGSRQPKRSCLLPCMFASRICFGANGMASHCRSNFIPLSEQCGVQPKLKYSGVVSNWIAFRSERVKKQESAKNSVGVKQSWLHRVTRYHANRLPLATTFFSSYFGDPRAMLYVQRALMHSVPACRFTSGLSYQLIKNGQPPDTTHVSKKQESEIRNTALPKFAQKKNCRYFFVPVFPRAAGREELN